MEIEFDTLKCEYVDAIFDIEEKSFPDPWPKKLISDEIKNDNACYAVALSNNAVIGYGGFYWILGEANVTNIAVHPLYRGRGIGSMILTKIIDACLKRKTVFLTLEVRKGNEPAIALYKKFGFNKIGIRKGYYADNGEDAVLMTKYF